MRQQVLILDFGSQYTQLIARRIRELNVYSQNQPLPLPREGNKRREPVGIVPSSGPASAYGEGAPHISNEIFELGIPVLGICYGAQLTAELLGGKVAGAQHHEYGRAHVMIKKAEGLFAGFGAGEDIAVWMSHG